MSKQPIILREEPHHTSGFSSFGAPPQYYGSRCLQSWRNFSLDFKTFSGTRSSVSVNPWSTLTMGELWAIKVILICNKQQIQILHKIPLGSMGHHGNHGMNMGGMAMGGTLPAHHTPYSRYEIIFHFWWKYSWLLMKLYYIIYYYKGDGQILLCGFCP